MPVASFRIMIHRLQDGYADVFHVTKGCPVAMSRDLALSFYCILPFSGTRLFKQGKYSKEDCISSRRQSLCST